MCSVEGCSTTSVGQGLCYKHGGKSHKKACSVEGCSTRSLLQGLCYKHGGWKVCSVEGCSTHAVVQGLCYKHGGRNNKVCSAVGCSTFAVGRGLCYKHGGKSRKLCNFQGCTTESYKGGLCYKHMNCNRDPQASAALEAALASARGSDWSVNRDCPHVKRALEWGFSMGFIEAMAEKSAQEEQDAVEHGLSAVMHQEETEVPDPQQQ